MALPPFGPGRLPSPVFTPYAPADVSPAEETSIAPPAAPAPAAPSFGQPVATPPFVAPPAAGPTMPQAQHAGAPNFFSAVMPILAAALAGGKDPRAVGEGLAAFQRGRQLKMAEQEHVADRKHREQAEAAEFYSRAIEQSQQLDDPIAFEQWRSAISPIAELHGINPAAFTFSDQKRQTKAKKDAQAVVDTMRKVHGNVVDDPAWQDAHTTELNGHQVKVSEVYRLAQLPSVRDQKGGLVGPLPKVDVPNTPEETFYQTYAKEHGAKTFGELTTALQADARQTWQRTNGTGLPNAGSFEDYLARYAKTRNRKVDDLTDKDIEDARKRYNQSDDKAAQAPRGRFNIQQVTNPDGSTGLVRVNMDTGDVTPVSLPDGTGAGHASDTQRLSKAYLDRTVASNTTATTFEASLAKLGPQLDVQLPNLLKSEQGQQYKQAENEFINAALRRESGAAIQPSEYARFEEIYFVRPGDTAATIKQKQDARTRVVAGFRVAAGSMGAPAVGAVSPKTANDPLGIR